MQSSNSGAADALAETLVLAGVFSGGLPTESSGSESSLDNTAASSVFLSSLSLPRLTSGAGAQGAPSVVTAAGAEAEAEAEARAPDRPSASSSSL